MNHIILLLLAVLVCGSILYYIMTMYRSEGFYDSSEYTALQMRLTDTLSPYCELAAYAQSQMAVIYRAIGESDSQAAIHLQKTYSDVYACRDDGASSRPSCSFGLASGSRSNSTPGFISCDTYLSLPAWSSNDNGQACAIALSAIPDDLADRIVREIDWYSQIITHLQTALYAGNSPPAKAPDSDTAPPTDSSGAAWSSGTIPAKRVSDTVEGFDSTCSPAQAAAQIEASAAGSCTIPIANDQITRVNAILDSPILQEALKQCSRLKDAMVTLKSDQQKAKDGTLYPWQRDGPKKTYKQFPTGDRTTNFLSSMQQNQS